MRLTDSQVCALVLALRVAVQVYGDDASCDCQHPRVAAQFRKQAAEAAALADQLEGADVDVTS